MSRVGPELLGTLFDGYGAALVLYARQWTELAEDVVQEAFLKLASQRRAPANPRAWLYRVVRNEALTARRRAARRMARENRRARASVPPAAGPDPGSSFWFSEVDQRLDASRAAELVRELDEELREVIVARLWGDLTFEEIAALQGSSVSTAHRRYRQGLQWLHERLNPPCPELDRVTEVSLRPN